GEDRERGGAKRTVREVRSCIPAPPQSATETPEAAEPCIRATLVVRNDLRDRGMSFQQRRCSRRRHHIHWPVPLGQCSKQTGSEDDVTQKGGLDDQSASFSALCSLFSIHNHSTCRTARNASCGISTAPICFIRFFPSFCFSSNLRFRVMSPP